MTDHPSPKQQDKENTSAAAVDTDQLQTRWNRFTSTLKSYLSEQVFLTWFAPLQPVNATDDILQVLAPSRFHYDWIEGHYQAQVESALRATFGSSCVMEYSVADPVNENNESSRQAAPVIAEVHQRASNSNNGNGRVANGLNTRYSFETFIEGPPNSFARAASVAVAESPGKTLYNPLLLYGGVGLGKTHLLQAIGNEVLLSGANLRVRYISSEAFTQDFVEAIKKNRADEFSSRFRAVDVLLLDDVQFLVGRERTQMEFFHTFNALHQAGKQIVLTSDKPPRDLGGLDERLVSRIGWGLVCDIGPPDYDTRVAIAHRFVEDEGYSLPSDVADFLASRFTRNIRELQGAVRKLLANVSLRNTSISLSLAQELLSDLVASREKSIPVHLIQRVVSGHFDISPDMLIAKIRSQPTARARMIAMALTVHITGLSLKQVGRQFGNRDHTTVLHARQSVESWVQEDREFATFYNQLKQEIESAAD